MSEREEALSRLTGPGGRFEITQERVLGVPMRIYAHAPTSLRDLLEATRAHGSREAFVYDEDRWTYDGFRAAVAGLAQHLASHYDLGKGDRVAIGMRNYPEWALAFWATQALGAVAVPLNAWWTGTELVYALRDSGASACVCDGERLERIAPHLEELRLRAVFAVRHTGALPAGAERFEEVSAVAGTADECPPVEIDPDDDSTILYTSGTTGEPKGAVGTHRNHVTNVMNTLLVGAVAAELAGGPPSNPPQGCALQTFPFFHIAGITGLCVNATVGNKAVLMYKWDAEHALDLVEREGVTSVSGVPTVVRELLEAAAAGSRDVSSLAGIASGGAPVPPDLIRRIDRDFRSKVRPGNGYGLTETTSAVIINSGPEYVRKPDSVGRPVPVADIRVVSPEGEDLPDGEVGELWVRGPNVVRGYWNKPEATATAFTDGWFHTGDLGFRDVEGFFYVVDRIKDVVIRGGENVYCAEVEAVFFEHPAVADVAVLGLPHHALGEEVVAVVQLRPGAETTREALQAYAAEQLAGFKVPTQIFLHAEGLPRTATGKVLKRELRDELLEGSPARGGSASRG